MDLSSLVCLFKLFVCGEFQVSSVFLVPIQCDGLVCREGEEAVVFDYRVSLDYLGRAVSLA